MFDIVTCVGVRFKLWKKIWKIKINNKFSGQGLQKKKYNRSQENVNVEGFKKLDEISFP